MGFIFQELLYRPIFNVLVVIYNAIPGHDFGMAIIVLTVFIRLIFSKWSVRALRSQRQLAELQPKIKMVQEKYKNDRTVQAQAVMALYKEHQVSPMAGCLPLLIQLPFLIALYQAFLHGFSSENLKLLYPFVTKPAEINNTFLGLLDLSTRNTFLVLLTAGLQFWQSKMSLPASAKENAPSAAPEMANINKQMLYFLPIMLIIIGWKLPAGLILYWAITTIFSIFEQKIVKRTLVKNAV